MRGRFLSSVTSLLSVCCALGCGNAGVDSTLRALCEAACERVVECFAGTTVAQCVSECVGAPGAFSCDRNQAAFDACVAGLAGSTCEALDAGVLPASCENVCLGEGLCDEVVCDDADDCTEDACDAANGTCRYNRASDGSACREGLGVCVEGLCAAEFSCTEQGIRDAIAFGGGPNTFACNGETTIITSSEIVIDNDVILDGGGDLRISGNATHRVLSVAFRVTAGLRRLSVVAGYSDDGGGIKNDGKLTITDSMVSDNRTSGDGGGILNWQGSLTLNGCEVRRNSAQSGGGIFNDAPLTMVDSTISGNVASTGGGVSSRAALTATDSFISNNTAEEWGGGIDGEDGTLTLTNVEVSGNTAGMSAGGIRALNGLTMTGTTVSGNAAQDGCGGGMLLDGNVRVANSTISGNSASGEFGCGGGISVVRTIASFQNMRFEYVTIAENRATWQGTAMYVDVSVTGSFPLLTWRNTLVQGDCAARMGSLPESLGYNLESPGDTCGFELPTDQVSVDAEDLGLGPLRDNGGRTETHGLDEGSVAVDAIPPTACEVDADQRGVERPQGDACDVGAFEVQR